MKKLGKLSISPEKIMKNEELINLKGGYSGGYPPCDCNILWSTGEETWHPDYGLCGTSDSCSQCAADLEAHYGSMVRSIACEGT